MHCTSQGKVFLAAMPDSEVIALLGRKSLTAYTPHTSTDVEVLLRTLETVRKQGYAVDVGELKIGLRSVSAPVYAVDGTLKYTIGVVGMFRNIRADEFLQAVDMVVSAGEMVSAALGYKT